MNNNFLNKEIYSIVDFQEKYVGLIICVYEFSQFYILFNQKKYNDNLEESIFSNYRKTSKYLKELIKTAENNLNFQIKKLFYNIDVNKLVIKKQEYFHNFDKQKTITKEDLKQLNKYFLKNASKLKNKEIIFSKINNYFLIDSNEIFDYAPINKTVSSIKLEGLIYYESWKTLYFYQSVFNKIKIKTASPLLLPYAIYISLLFSQKDKNVIILNWKKNNIQVFKFENKVFTDFLILKKGINDFLEKFSKKFEFEFSDIKNFLYQTINLSNDENEVLNLYFESYDKKKKEIQDNLKFYFKEYVETIITLILEKILKENSNNNENVFFLVNDITKISGIFEIVESIFKNVKFKKHNPLFVGIKNYNDSFLIGNAYYHHLKNKVIYN